MVKQAPVMSAGPSLPSRAFFASSPHSAAIWLTDFWSTFLITGTTRPFGVSAAKAMLRYFFSTRFSPSSELLKSGNFFSASSQALIRKASMVIFAPPDFSVSLFSARRKASSSVMSASSW